MRCKSRRLIWGILVVSGRISEAEGAKRLLAKVKDFSDRQTRLDPAFYCKPEGVPRMGPPTQIVQTRGQVVFLYEVRPLASDGLAGRQMSVGV